MVEVFLNLSYSPGILKSRFGFARVKLSYVRVKVSKEVDVCRSLISFTTELQRVLRRLSGVDPSCKLVLSMVIGV